MTQTFTCWHCGATRRFGDNHCCGRASFVPRGRDYFLKALGGKSAARPRRQWRASPVGSLARGMLFWLVCWIALIIGVLAWGASWRSP